MSDTSEPNPPVAENPRSTARILAQICAFIVIFAGLVYAGLHFYQRRAVPQPLIPLQSNGREAPAFALTTPEGKVVHLADFRGKAVLLNFFGDTCAPCRVESPWLVEIQSSDRPKGLEIIGVEMYGASNDAVNQYRKDFGTNYTVVHGTDAVADQYGVGDLPTSYFIDRDGKIVASTVGLHSKQDLETDVASALGGK
ncbi:MAG TPA: TlpA disulfide reductase family protein [Terriglobales bacterium]|nr:TlpA disulfide reductase family protein [Terriglobales bacterium]